MLIKISKGEVHLKEKLTVRDYYELQCAESAAMVMTQDGVSLDGKAVNALKEKKVILVIEKILVEEKEREVNIDTLLNDDYLTIEDFTKVFPTALSHCVKLQKKTEPSKKSLPTSKK